MTEQKKSRLSWGVGVWLIYGGFVIFILACVVVASMQQFDLVEDNYYERGVGYQQDIDRNQRTSELADQPAILLTPERAVQVIFPAAFTPTKLSGTVKLYRPSNSRYDKNYGLKVDNLSTMLIPMNDLPTGLWKVKLAWNYDGKTYYNEETIIVE